MELSCEAYKNVANILQLLHDELKVQIDPSLVVLKSNQLPQGTSESKLKEALKYLSQKEVIVYDCEVKYSALFYEYDNEYKKS